MTDSVSKRLDDLERRASVPPPTRLDPPPVVKPDHAKASAEVSRLVGEMIVDMNDEERTAFGDVMRDWNRSIEALAKINRESSRREAR